MYVYFGRNVTNPRRRASQIIRNKIEMRKEILWALAWNKTHLLDEKTHKCRHPRNSNEFKVHVDRFKRFELFEYKTGIIP